MLSITLFKPETDRPAGNAVVFPPRDRKSTRLNSSHLVISYAVFCLKKKNHLSSTQHDFLTLVELSSPSYRIPHTNSTAPRDSSWTYLAPSSTSAALHDVPHHRILY